MIKLTDKQFDSIIATVITEALDILAIRTTTESQEKNLISLAAHANSLASTHNSNNSKVNVKE